jgi:hypothetical protein
MMVNVEKWPYQSINEGRGAPVCFPLASNRVQHALSGSRLAETKLADV